MFTKRMACIFRVLSFPCPWLVPSRQSPPVVVVRLTERLLREIAGGSTQDRVTHSPQPDDQGR